MDLPKNDFKFSTPDISSLSKLCYGLRDLLKIVRFYITKNGIKVSESAGQNQLFLFAEFKAELFETFSCSGDLYVSFHPEILYKVLSSHSQRDVVEFSFNHKKPRFIEITIYCNGEKNQIKSYKVPQLLTTTEILESPREEVDYLLAFDSQEICNIIECLSGSSIDSQNKILEIECSKKQIQFKVDSGVLISDSKITMITEKDETFDRSEKKRIRRSKKHDNLSTINTDREILGTTKIVKQRYKIHFLNQLTKCFQIDSNILLYIKEGFPIIFEVNIGSIGKFRCALLFLDEIEEEESNESENE